MSVTPWISTMTMGTDNDYNKPRLRLMWILYDKQTNQLMSANKEESGFQVKEHIFA